VPAVVWVCVCVQPFDSLWRGGRDKKKWRCSHEKGRERESRRDEDNATLASPFERGGGGRYLNTSLLAAPPKQFNVLR
jgi:hypothetical protein